MTGRNGATSAREPCLALDPITTPKIEELIFSLHGKYTVLILTQNMKYAADVSDYTAIIYLGRLVELSSTNVRFLNPRISLS